MGEVKSGSVSTIEDIEFLLPAEWAMLDERARSLDFRRLRHDAQLQRLALQSWREYLERSTVSREKLEEALDRDDLKPGDLWGPGLTETLSVASTPEDVRRYRKKLEFRAQVLSSVLEETLAELERSAKWKPFADAENEKAEKDERASP
jgi:hypothetical protein